MLPQALLSFPGISQVISWSFTLSHGITPSVAQVEIAPQFGVPAEIGTMVISFGDVSLEFPGCVLDRATVRRDRAGMVVSLAILDRRWAWRFGAISGRYNVRRKDGALDSDTEQSPQELATLLLTAMGESNFDVSGLPNDSRPEMDWVYANPAQELANLADSLGCRVVLDLDNAVAIQPAGTGADLPETGTERTQDFGIDPPTRPDSLLLVGGPTRFQTMFRLEAVGQEKSGEIKPINSLSYTPSSGWGQEAWFGLANVTDAAARAIARRTVFRWYRIKCTAPFSTEGRFQIQGYDGTVSALWQILPVENGLIEMYTDSDGIDRPMPPRVQGVFWDDSLDGNNVASERPYPGAFTIDRDRGIVRFAEAVMQVVSAGKFGEAEIYLTIAHGVKDAGSLQAVRRTTERALPGEPSGTGPQVVRRDDLVRTVVTTYDSSHNPTGTTDNAQDFDEEAGYSLDAAEAEFQTLLTGYMEYAGITPISPDGAIQQVEWRGGLSGGTTRASRNSEFSLVVPSWKERRAAERGRNAEEQIITAASASALKDLRDFQGGR